MFTIVPTSILKDTEVEAVWLAGSTVLECIKKLLQIKQFYTLSRLPGKKVSIFYGVTRICITASLDK